MSRKKIGIDFDDVLADFGRHIVAEYNASHGTAHTVDMMREINLEKLWGTSRDYAVDFVNKYFPNTGKTPLVEGAKEAVITLAKDHDLVLITGRPETAAEVTQMWLEEHFPGVFKTTYFNNMFYGEQKMSKAEFCLAHGIDIMIDDFIGTAIDVSKAGVPVLLFNQPWNQGDLPERVTRVRSWEEILQNL